MFAYIINTKDSSEEAFSIESAFGKLGIPSRQIARCTAQSRSAMIPKRETSTNRIRDYSSPQRDENGYLQQHLTAYELFLASKEHFALICEDTVVPIPRLSRILDEAAIYSDVWDILRLSGLPRKRSRRVAHLRDGFWLTVSFARLQGSVLMSSIVMLRRCSSRSCGPREYRSTKSLTVSGISVSMRLRCSRIYFVR